MWSLLVAVAMDQGNQLVARQTAERAFAVLNKHPLYDHAAKVRILVELATTLRDHEAMPEARTAVERALHLAQAYVRANDVRMAPVIERLHRLQDDLTFRGFPPRKRKKVDAVSLPEAAFQAIRAMGDSFAQCDALARLAPVLPVVLLPDALSVIQESDDAWARAEAFGAFADAYPDGVPTTALSDTFTALLEDQPEWNEDDEDDED